MRDVVQMNGVHRSTIHMCEYGLKDPASGTAMNKHMSFLHNVPMELFSNVIRRCRREHEHQRIEGASPGHGSRAILSQVYPWSFCSKLAEVLVKIQEQAENNVPQTCSPAIDEDLGRWVDVWEELANESSNASIKTSGTQPTHIPAMPCLDTPIECRHQEHSSAHPLLHHAMVARPVNRLESTTQPKAIAAMKAEWSTMHQKVWNCWEVREKKDVIHEARRRNAVVQFGRVHGICVEKNSELSQEHPNRKYKGRVVFLGNRVSNQDLEAATFADLGNAPANLESGRLADCYGACPGHASENADGVQAYLQANMRGDACWVELPKDAHPGGLWGPDNLTPSEIRKLVAMWSKLRCPVVLMTAALYGHPERVFLGAMV